MSKFKVGDQARGWVSSDTYNVLGVTQFGNVEKVWVENLTRGGGVRNLSIVSAENLNKIVPFFEVGKKYTMSGDTFEPVRVEEQSDGIMIAFGKVTSPRGFIWRMKDESVFSFWTEV